jgi:hypothetical protein
MKKFISRKVRLVLEGVSAISYHFTSLNALYDILTKNEFKLTFSLGTDTDFKFNKNKFNFMSLTRSKSSGYRIGNVKLVIDSKGISNNYKIIPVDYWGSSSGLDLEQEDRIISDKNTIPNAIKYIKEIHIYIKESHLHQYDNNMINTINNISNSNNIKVFYYNDRKNFLYQIKPIDKSQLTDYIQTTNSNKYESDYNLFDYELASLVAHNNENNYNAIIDYLKDDVNKLDRFKKEFDKIKNKYLTPNSYHKDDFKTSIKNTIHNNKTLFYKGDYQFLFNLLKKDYRIVNAINLNDYIEKKIWGDKKTIDEHKKDLIEYIKNVVNNIVINKFNDLNGRWIELEGDVYYNNVSESMEILKFISQQKSILLDEYRDVINTIDIFKEHFKLKGEYLTFDWKKIDVTSQVSVVDYADPINYLIDTIKEIFYHAILEVDNRIENKIKLIYNEYYNYNK